MLPGMLLHVVEPAEPVHLALHPRIRQRLGEEMGDPVAFIYNVGDLDAIDRPGITGLPPRRGIEGRAVEVDSTAVLCLFNHGSFEFAKVGVEIVETLGHGGVLSHPDGRSHGSRQLIQHLTLHLGGEVDHGRELDG